MQADLYTGPGSSNGVNFSTIVTVYQNNIPTPYQIGFGDGQSSIKTFYASSITFNRGDEFSVNYTYTGGVSNATHDVSLQFDLY
jgi:hypothetical protein